MVFYFREKTTVYIWNSFLSVLKRCFKPERREERGTAIADTRKHAVSINPSIQNPLMGLSITIDKLRVFINKTLSTQSLINQLLIKRVGLSIVIDNGKIGQGMRSCKCTNHNLYAGGCQ